MAFTLTLNPSKTNDIAHLAASGQATAIDLRGDEAARFEAILGSDWSSRLVMLDMENVSYIDSAAIGWFMNTQKTFRANGGMMALHSVGPNIRNILDLLKIGRIIPLARDAAAARVLLLQDTRPVNV